MPEQTYMELLWKSDPVIKHCGNCKYKATEVVIEPCRSCRQWEGIADKWKPRT